MLNNFSALPQDPSELEALPDLTPLLPMDILVKIMQEATPQNHAFPPNTYAVNHLFQKATDTFRFNQSNEKAKLNPESNSSQNNQKQEIAYLLENEADILAKTNHDALVIASFQRLKYASATPETVRTFMIREEILNILNMAIIEARIKMGTCIQLDCDHCHLTRFPGKIFKNPIYQEYWSKLRMFSARDNKLKKLPPEINRMQALQHLFLSENLLQSLPSTFGNLGMLKVIDLSDNQLMSIPSIAQLKSVECLMLSGNQLQMLPSDIGGMASLVRLEVQNNMLKELPESIGQLLVLKRLFLDENKLQTFPAQLGNLSALEQLSADNNQLTHLPLEIGQLSSLQELSLSDNLLENLPFEIGQITTLGRLLVDNNQLQNLTSGIRHLRNLQTLALHNNHLQNLPAEIDELENLSMLMLENNQLSSLPHGLRETVLFQINGYRAIPIKAADLLQMQRKTVTKSAESKMRIV